MEARWAADAPVVSPAEDRAVFLAVDGRAARREVLADSPVALVGFPAVRAASPEGQAVLPAVRLAVRVGLVDSPAEWLGHRGRRLSFRWSGT